MDKLRQRMPPLKLSRSDYKVLQGQVLARDAWRCQLCGSSNNLQVHHIQPRGGLGDDELRNLITL